MAREEKPQPSLQTAKAGLHNWRKRFARSKPKLPGSGRKSAADELGPSVVFVAHPFRFSRKGWGFFPWVVPMAREEKPQPSLQTAKAGLQNAKPKLPGWRKPAAA